MIFAIFLILHGLVHLLYFGQSRRLFELQPGMVWPDGSWAFSRLVGDQNTRLLASLCCVVPAIGFVVAGMVLLVEQDWWGSVTIGSAAFSAVTFILFWDRKMQKLPDKGAIGVLINLAILVGLLILDWPSFDF